MPPDAGGRRAKVPRVKWTKESTTDEETIRGWWRRWPLAMPGWRLPPGVAVVDVDDPAVFEAAGLGVDLVTASQVTPRGGYHLAYSHDPGRAVRQTVKEIEGADTRVGGLGWVGLYDEGSFSQPMAAAPEWLYGEAPGRRDHSGDELDEMGTRDEIIRWVGGLRRARMTGEEILGALFAAREEGRIAALDEARPWRDSDLRAIAREAGRWEPGPELPDTAALEGSLAGLERWKQRVRGRAEQLPGRAPEGARALIVPISEYRRSVPKDIPWVAAPYLYHGGVTLLAGPPKGGKSTLMANLQRELEEGGTFLGVGVPARPTLLVTEEGGVAVIYKTGGMSRLEVLDRRAATLADLSYPQVLAAVRDWCAEWDTPAVVFVDTLAVWAELEDENSSTQVTRALDLVNQLAAETQAAVVLVHHTRKGGGKDGEAIRGSSAIFASVDIALELSRPREGSSDRRLDIQGRVVLPLQVDLEFDEGRLSYGLRSPYEISADDDPVSRLPDTDRAVAAHLRGVFPEWARWQDVARETGLGGASGDSVRKACVRLSGPNAPYGGERRKEGATPYFRLPPWVVTTGTPHGR